MNDGFSRSRSMRSKKNSATSTGSRLPFVRRRPIAAADCFSKLSIMLQRSPSRRSYRESSSPGTSGRGPIVICCARTIGEGGGDLANLKRIFDFSGDHCIGRAGVRRRSVPSKRRGEAFGLFGLSLRRRRRYGARRLEFLRRLPRDREDARRIKDFG